MECRDPSITLGKFWQRLARCGRGVLLLDYDGTLAPFREDPAAALPYPGVAALIDRIIERGRTRVAIVTGRSVTHGLPQAGLRQPVELFGGHGREHRRADGSHVVSPVDEATRQALAVVDGWAESVCRAGGRCERKPGSIAFHWRGLPADAVARIGEMLDRQWRASSMAGVLRWLDFDGGVELVAPGRRKSDVVHAVLEEVGGDPGDVAAAFLGDDHTDEDGFTAIAGRGIGILVRPQWRPTAADVWLKPPAELLDFLATWDRTLGTLTRTAAGVARRGT